jgi:hypothetical protein
MKLLPDEWDMFTDDLTVLRTLARDIRTGIRNEFEDHRRRRADTAADEQENRGGEDT